jgi:ribonuclease HI
MRAAKHELVKLHMPLPPLLHDWREFIYTDGSLLSEDAHVFPGIGAAVYVPANEDKQRAEEIIAVDCHYESEPGSPACVNTINRAELAAIRVAVAKGTTLSDDTGDIDIHIATDSLASIFQVRRATTRPQDMREHIHLSFNSRHSKHDHKIHMHGASVESKKPYRHSGQ